MNSNLQVFPQILNGIQVWALAGPLKDFHILVLKPFQCYFGCMLGVIVLLECKSSLQSKVFCTLKQVLPKDLLYFAPFIVPSILTSLPVPAAVKHPYSMKLPPPCFLVGMVLDGW